jgi:hypothetical protein
MLHQFCQNTVSSTIRSLVGCVFRLERDALPLFRMLRQKYKPSLDRDPSLDEVFLTNPRVNVLNFFLLWRAVCVNKMQYIVHQFVGITIHDIHKRTLYHHEDGYILCFLRS